VLLYQFIDGLKLLTFGRENHTAHTQLQPRCAAVLAQQSVAWRDHGRAIKFTRYQHIESAAARQFQGLRELRKVKRCPTCAPVILCQFCYHILEFGEIGA